MLELILTREDANTEFAARLVVAGRGRRRGGGRAARLPRRDHEGRRRARRTGRRDSRAALRRGRRGRARQGGRPRRAVRGGARAASRAACRAGDGARRRSAGPGHAQGCGARRASRGRPLNDLEAGLHHRGGRRIARPRPRRRAGSFSRRRARRCLDRRRDPARELFRGCGDRPARRPVPRAVAKRARSGARASAGGEGRALSQRRRSASARMCRWRTGHSSSLHVSSSKAARGSGRAPRSSAPRSSRSVRCRTSVLGSRCAAGARSSA